MEEQREPLAGGEQVRRRPARAATAVDARTLFQGYERARGERPGGRAAHGTARRVEALERGRAGRGGARPHALLRRGRRPGGRHRRADRGRRRCSQVARHAEARRGASSHLGTLEAGAIRIGDGARGAGRRRAPSGHRAQPLRHAPAARGAAQGAGHARAAEGLAGGARPAALRFLALPAGDAGRARPQIERLVNAQIRANTAADTRLMDYDAGGGRRRHGAVRREVRRATCACCAWATSPRSCAAARTCSAPATSACSRSSARAASPRACAASRR